MQYWLIKTEPEEWSWTQQVKEGNKGVEWSGVRNFQAANNLRKMQKGDLCFFYHSNIGKEIVGIVEVIKTAFIDPTDKKKRFVAVKVKFKNKLQSTQTNIERIFLREEEKTFSNPNINIYIGSYDNEENINRKSNIHRARLSKFKKSKLNGEMIFQDDEQRIYKFNNGKKVYL